METENRIFLKRLGEISGKNITARITIFSSDLSTKYYDPRNRAYFSTKHIAFSRPKDKDARYWRVFPYDPVKKRIPAFVSVQKEGIFMEEIDRSFPELTKEV